jgi:hypothetical protein
MPRLLKTAVLSLVACLLPIFALHAQQPSPTAPTSSDSKEASKPAQKDDASAKSESDVIAKIKEEGLKKSQVMATLSYLTDVIGPRLTGSPNLKRANVWTKEKLTEWGLENAHLEPWGPFGKGWALKRFSAQVTEPQCIPLIAFPKAWSPGTDGMVEGEVVYLDAKAEADLAKYKGKLKGAIVLTGPPRNLSARFEPMATRLTDSELLVLADAGEPAAGRGGFRRPTPDGAPANPTTVAATSAGGAGAASTNGAAPVTGTAAAQPGDARPQAGPGGPGGPGGRFGGQFAFNARKLQFLMEEGAALALDPSTQGDGGTLFVASASVPGATPMAGPGGRRVSAWDKDAPKTLPQVTVSAEHYNRLVRMIEQGEKLKIAIDLAVEFFSDDLMAYNTVAEIPGTDLKNEVVMLGGHMDSWHSGTGATDNAAGISCAMEAVRILKALDIKPRRTIRVALWTGEEQGLLGSRAYVTEHFGKAPPSFGGGGGRAGAAESNAAPKESTESTKPEFEAFSGYFNLDNGTGKIRGVYLQGNDGVRPVFRKWLQPFRDMGATTLTLSNTGGTDHQSFDGIGLPGFQFIQDRIDYNTRTHHSNQDLYDRIQADDMKQASVIMAAFVYNTAMRDEKLPRKPKAADAR